MKSKKAAKKRIVHKAAKRPTPKKQKVVKKKPVKKVHKIVKPVIKAKKPEEQKKMQKTQPKKEADINYVEVTVNCTECGKEVKIVTLEGSDNSEFLCQKCSSGEFFEEEDES